MGVDSNGDLNNPPVTFFIPLVIFKLKSLPGIGAVVVSITFFIVHMAYWGKAGRLLAPGHGLTKSEVLSLKPLSVRWDLPGMSRLSPQKVQSRVR